jgi:hypothetical protein
MAQQYICTVHPYCGRFLDPGQLRRGFLLTMSRRANQKRTFCISWLRLLCGPRRCCREVNRSLPIHVDGINLIAEMHQSCSRKFFQAASGQLCRNTRISSGSLPRVSRTNLSSLIRRRRGIRGQKADLLRRMVTRISETIIFCHALNVSANTTVHRTTRSYAGWVREQGWVPCAQGTPQGVKR